MNAILLAGGQSRRMGMDKARVEFGGMPLARWLAERLRPHVAEVIVVADDPRPFAGLGVRVVPDAFPGRGPLGGLHAGLAASAAPWNFAVACDLPFASPGLAAELARHAAAGPHDAAVPLVGGRPEPLHAVYARRCLPAVEAELRQGGAALVDLLHRLDVEWFCEDALAPFGDPAVTFLNVNRPADLAQARRLLAAVGKEGNRP